MKRFAIALVLLIGCSSPEEKAYRTIEADARQKFAWVREHARHKIELVGRPIYRNPRGPVDGSEFGSPGSIRTRRKAIVSDERPFMEVVYLARLWDGNRWVSGQIGYEYGQDGRILSPVLYSEPSDGFVELLPVEDCKASLRARHSRPDIVVRIPDEVVGL